MTSRTAVARYLATSLQNGSDREKVTQEAAAWLKEHGKSRQAGYLAQDVAVALADDGYMFAQFTTARPISSEIKTELQTYIADSTGARKIECEFLIDDKLIGGVLVHTPYGTLDASVRARLAKIVEGASR
jgi:hypothetical protein